METVLFLLDAMFHSVRHLVVKGISRSTSCLLFISHYLLHVCTCKVKTDKYTFFAYILCLNDFVDSLGSLISLKCTPTSYINFVGWLCCFSVVFTHCEFLILICFWVRVLSRGWVYNIQEHVTGFLCSLNQLSLAWCA